MNKNTITRDTHLHKKKKRTILKAIGSILLALVATAHHWLHLLLIALGLTTIGAGLLKLPPSIKILLMLFALAVSIWFIFVAKRKWPYDRPAAWVYLISSLISIVIVLTSVPQTLSSIIQSPKQQHEDMKGHSDMK